MQLQAPQQLFQDISVGGGAVDPEAVLFEIEQQVDLMPVDLGDLRLQLADRDELDMPQGKKILDIGSFARYRRTPLP